MAEPLLPTWTMETKRILHSDKHYHKVELSEQSMQVILHALYVLRHAFDQEQEYMEIIHTASKTVRNAYSSECSEQP